MSNPSQLLVHRQQESLGARADLHRALQLLEGTRDGSTGPMLRIYRPLPTVAFGQRDQRMQGFGAAQQAARDLGFEPVVRRAGGRAAAYTPGSLIIDHIEPDPDPIRESQARFSAFAELLTEALIVAGVTAQVGPLPGEYCYGEHSVHGLDPQQPDRRVKLVGTAQRQIATGWLFSSSVVVTEGREIRRVLTEVYSALGLEWDPLTAGSAADVAPGVTACEVENAVLETYAQYWDLTSATIGT